MHLSDTSHVHVSTHIRRTLVDCSELRVRARAPTDLRPGDVDDAGSLLLQQVGDEAVLQRVCLHLHITGVATARQSQQQTVLPIVLCVCVSGEPGVYIYITYTCSVWGEKNGQQQG